MPVHFPDILRSLDFGLVFRAVIEIAFVSYVTYRVILLAKGRRAWWILIGLGVFFALILLSDLFGLIAVNWLLRQVLPFGPVAIVILFYPELRELLEKMGRGEFLGAPLRVASLSNIEETIDVVVRTAGLLSPLKTGAIMVMEREIGLDDIVATGTPLDATPTHQLLSTIFFNGTPLHDGAVILRGGRIAAAGCRLPLSDAPNIAGNVHMRHRAALGLAETSDAVVVVVSEETGTISLVLNGRMRRGIPPDELRNKLLEAFGKARNPMRRANVHLFFPRRRETS
ncbi:MAG: diadenylate cyclase CdaA [Capsulimonadales bacterium]|nr:diadenylate cyclase CdaA [Capsulimonadales bacterium]